MGAVRGNRSTSAALLAAFSALLVVACSSSCTATTANARIVAAAGEGAGACAIVEGGRVHCWYEGAAVWIPGIADAESLSVQQPEGCAVRRGGLVSCWRYSADLGKQKIYVEDVSLDAVSRVVMTMEQACAIVANGGVSCWRTNRHPHERMQPARAANLTDVVDLAFYYGRALALQRGGHLIDFGVGDSPGVLTVVATVADAAQVALGDHFACLRTRAGSVSCWGDNWMGRLGDGTLISRDDPRPVAGLSNVVEIGAGVGHACALHADGTVSCWGSNQYGEVGVKSEGLSDARKTPVQVPGVHAESLVVVHYGACAVTTAHELVCWGNGDGPRRMEVSAPKDS